MHPLCFNSLISSTHAECEDFTAYLSVLNAVCHLEPFSVQIYEVSLNLQCL